MAEGEEVRHFVSDHHRGAGFRHPGHLTKRGLGVVEMVEAASLAASQARPLAHIGTGEGERIKKLFGFAVTL
jgi:hypothetical protein